MWKTGGPMSPECIVSMVKSQKDSEIIYKRIDPIEKLEKQSTEQTSMF